MSRPFLLLGLLVLQCLSNKYDKESIRRLLGIVHKKFYIYSWPDVLDRWPDYYTHHRLALASGFKDNYGIGIRKNASEGISESTTVKFNWSWISHLFLSLLPRVISHPSIFSIHDILLPPFGVAISNARCRCSGLVFHSI